MPQPTNSLIRIAESNINTPSTGLPNKKEPSSILQTIGWDKDQIVAGNHLNYILDNLAEHIAWVQEQVNLTATKEYIDTQDADLKTYVDTSINQSITDVKNTTLTAGDGLSGGGNLQGNRSFAVDNSVVRTTRQINGNPLDADIILTSDEITGASTAVLAGDAIAHGSTLPIPTGYTLAQCKFIVSINDSGAGEWNIDEGLTKAHYRTTCSVNQSTGVVTAQRIIWNDPTDTYITTAATANYMVIGVK